MSTMSYKGYTAIVDYSAEDECFVGHLAEIEDIVGFHGDSEEEIGKAFEETVDFYIQTRNLR